MIASFLIALLFQLAPSVVWEATVERAEKERAELIGAYTHVASDPWVEDISMNHVALAYETAPGGRITRIIQTINGQTEKVVTISC